MQRILTLPRLILLTCCRVLRMILLSMLLGYCAIGMPLVVTACSPIYGSVTYMFYRTFPFHTTGTLTVHLIGVVLHLSA